MLKMAICTVAGPYRRSDSYESDVAKTSADLAVYSSSTSSSENEKEGINIREYEKPSVGEGTVAETAVKWAWVALCSFTRCLPLKRVKERSYFINSLSRQLV